MDGDANLWARHGHSAWAVVVVDDDTDGASVLGVHDLGGEVADTAADQGDLAGAQELLDRSLESEPGSSESLYLLGQLALMRGDATSGEQYFQQALDADPSTLGANNDLAWILASDSRDLEKALRLAQRAVKAEPNADTLDTLGFVHLQRGEADEAVETLSRALQARPESGSIGYRLGTALVAKGDREGARTVLIEALKKPGFPETEAAQQELARLQGS